MAALRMNHNRSIWVLHFEDLNIFRLEKQVGRAESPLGNRNDRLSSFPLRVFGKVAVWPKEYCVSAE